MTQAPTPGPLDSESVKLLVKGDLLRVIEAGSFLLGRGLVDGGVATVRSVDGPYIDVYGPAERSDNRASRFAFIGRPDADGWIFNAEGWAENPVPGTTVEYRCRSGSTWALPVSVPSEVLRWGNSGWSGDIIAFRLAPPAPVEASGSERVPGWPVGMTRGAIDDVVSGRGLPPLQDPDPRPQPSGETREAVRLRDDIISIIEDARQSAVPESWEVVSHAADRILALLSARPLALGGQHSGGEASWCPIDDNGLAEVRVNGKRITSVPSYDEAKEVAERINAALSTTPARAEAMDEGAAGSFEERALMLTKKHGNPVGTDYEQGQNDMGHRMVTMAREADAALTAARAHPSPTPAADADRVREPNLFWSAESWEYTHSDLTEAYEEATGGTYSGVAKIGNALELPPIWAAQIDIDTTVDGEADDYEIKTFPTKEEADAYLADALKSTAAKEGGE